MRIDFDGHHSCVSSFVYVYDILIRLLKKIGKESQYIVSRPETGSDRPIGSDRESGCDTKGPNFLFLPRSFSTTKTSMTRSGGSDRRTLVKGSSNNKGKIFDQEGSAMDPIIMEPLSSAMIASLVPYDTYEDEFLAAYALAPKKTLQLVVKALQV